MALEDFGGLASYQQQFAPPPTALTAQLPQFGEGIPSGLGGAGGMGALGYANAAISGIETLGKLWMGFKAAKMAKKQFKFAKDITNTNLANQIKSYNTALADRARSRGVMESQSQDQVDAYVANNSLNRSQSRPTGYNNNYRDASTPVASSSPTVAGIGGFSALAARAAAERPTDERRAA